MTKNAGKTGILIYSRLKKSLTFALIAIFDPIKSIEPCLFCKILGAVLASIPPAPPSGCLSYVTVVPSDKVALYTL